MSVSETSAQRSGCEVSEVLETDIEGVTSLVQVTCRRFVCAVCEARANWQSKRRNPTVKLSPGLFVLDCLRTERAF